MHRIIYRIALLLTAAVGLTACHDMEEYTDDRGQLRGPVVDTRRALLLLDSKNVDWDKVHDTYSRRISDRMTREELFIVCADMLAELRDGHVNLSAPFNTSYYRAWWSDYPQNFNKTSYRGVLFQLQLPPVVGHDVRVSRKQHRIHLL